MPISVLPQRRWLEFLSLAWVSIASLWWLTYGGPAWLPILIALAAIGLGASAGRFPFRRTPFGLLLLLFGLTALVGVWAAYDRSAAWEKFWVLALAILVYDALAGQPRQNVWLVSGLLSLWAILISLNFWLVNDWQALPADFRLITRLGLAWMAVRPAAPGQALAPNLTAGILAGLFPFTLALGLAAWHSRREFKNLWLAVAGSVASAGLLLLTLFMTSSRGAWLALAAGLGGWLFWGVGEKVLARQPGRQKLLLATGGGVLLIFLFGLIFALPGGVMHLLALAPGLPTGQSRLGIDRWTLRLIGDFPFTGGGLGAFAGLFSHYMLVIPHVMFTYGHNLYLDVALEQGLVGLALLLALGVGSAMLLFRSPAPGEEPASHKLLRQAALVSLLIAGLHGMVDDPFYGGQGTPFLWVIPGIAALLHPQVRSLGEILPQGSGRGAGRRAMRVALGAAGVLLMLGVAAALVAAPRRLVAGWLANRGAVELARVQLSDFPSTEWDRPADAWQLALAQVWFEQALSLDPSNRTANHRLGLIALQRKDFTAAIRYLEAALRQDPGHRGVLKNLGYAYVWAGEYEQAQPLLAQVMEAKQELRTYVWWWQSQGRPDLAQNAEQMRQLLAGGTSLLKRPGVTLGVDQNDLSLIR